MLNHRCYADYMSPQHCLQTPTGSTDFWSPKELIYQFTAETRRLWEREQYQCHITTVQACGILGYTLCCDGLDKIGFQYLKLAIGMAEGMELFSAIQAGDARRQAVVAATSWGLFSMQA